MFFSLYLFVCYQNYCFLQRWIQPLGWRTCWMILSLSSLVVRHYRRNCYSSANSIGFDTFPRALVTCFYDSRPFYIRIDQEAEFLLFPRFAPASVIRIFFCAFPGPSSRSFPGSSPCITHWRQLCDFLCASC